MLEIMPVPNDAHCNECDYKWVETVGEMKRCPRCVGTTINRKSIPKKDKSENKRKDT